MTGPRLSGPWAAAYARAIASREPQPAWCDCGEHRVERAGDKCPTCADEEEPDA